MSFMFVIPRFPIYSSLWLKKCFDCISCFGSVQVRVKFRLTVIYAGLKTMFKKLIPVIFIDWSIVCFSSTSRMFPTYRDVTIAGGRTVEFGPLLGACGLWVGRDLYRAVPALTRDLGSHTRIRRNAPLSQLLRQEIVLWKFIILLRRLMF